MIVALVIALRDMFDGTSNLYKLKHHNLYKLKHHNNRDYRYIIYYTYIIYIYYELSIVSDKNTFHSYNINNNTVIYLRP